jgi:hypothetical protein
LRTYFDREVTAMSFVDARAGPVAPDLYHTVDLARRAEDRS